MFYEASVGIGARENSRGFKTPMLDRNCLDLDLKAKKMILNKWLELHDKGERNGHNNYAMVMQEAGKDLSEVLNLNYLTVQNILGYIEIDYSISQMSEDSRDDPGHPQNIWHTIAQR